ncbi:acylphosphatase [Candidatus Peregrinibacteria bacterium]|nr:acylphosphatase [Candidatus Peregrinibacteria bacterium]
MKKQVHVKISGKVQGVFFRAETCEKGRKLGLTGWVRNTLDGGVEAVAQGEEDRLQHFVTWCWDGPDSAHVKNVAVEWRDQLENFPDFSIR